MCMFCEPVGLSNKLSCGAWSFFCHLNPHRFFQSKVLRLYFLAMKSWVVWSVSLPSCFSQFICTQMWDRLLHLPLPRPDCQLLFAGQLKPCLPRSTVYHLAVSVSHGLARPGPPAMALLRVLSAQLRVSAPPTGLDEWFFFNSLVVRLPYS